MHSELQPQGASWHTGDTVRRSFPQYLIYYQCQEVCSMLNVKGTRALTGKQATSPLCLSFKIVLGTWIPWEVKKKREGETAMDATCPEGQLAHQMQQQQRGGVLGHTLCKMTARSSRPGQCPLWTKSAPYNISLKSCHAPKLCGRCTEATQLSNLCGRRSWKEKLCKPQLSVGFSLCLSVLQSLHPFGSS